MTEFKKWIHEYGHGELISQRYELEDAWKAALEFIKRELYEVRAHGFEPDMGLSNLLKRELEEADK